MLGLQKGWSLKRVRRTLAQGTVGKGIAIMLGIWQRRAVGKVTTPRCSGYTTATAARCISRQATRAQNTSTGTCGGTWRRRAARQVRIHLRRLPMRLATR